ncbi:MAG: transposase, partial [Armatimonadetes bacterium CG_4_8_14_3_um_filter_66_20]
MRYDPTVHHRRSIRLPEYDYSTPGAYFVTICTQDRQCLFGDITDDAMRPNEAGRMVEAWWRELTSKFPTTSADAHILMPNHVHGIVAIEREDGAPLGAMVQWFKTMTTNAYIQGVRQDGWAPFPGRLWQRNYFERIVRDDDELFETREYIASNPVNWEHDEDNP